jgi:hypothetical protein
MLNLRWFAANAGNPDAAAYGNAVDRLFAGTPPSPVQDFRRGDHGLADPAPGLAAALDAWLDGRTDRTAAVTVMVHGFQFNPSDSVAGGDDDPFHSVYGTPGVAYGGAPPLDPRMSWLPLVGECDEAGRPLADCAIGFGWTSEGTMRTFSQACWDNGYKYAALDLAPAAARALATVLSHVAGKARLRLFAHSLGTRTTNQAIALLPEGALSAIERVILLGGAEYCVDARESLAESCDVVSLGSQRDRVVRLGEMACDPVRNNNTIASMVIARNGLGGQARWLDLQIDSAQLVAWLSEGRAPNGANYAINALPLNDVHPSGDLGHWVYFTNEGNRKLVRDLVLHPAMTRAGLVASGVPAGFTAADGAKFATVSVPATPMACAERHPQLQATRGGRGAAVA